MPFGYALFLAAVFAYPLMLSVNFWVTKFGRGMGCLAMCLVFLASTIAIVCILLFAPYYIQNIAIGVSLGFIALSIIVNSIFK